MKKSLICNFLIGFVFLSLLGVLSAIPCLDTDGNDLETFGTVSNPFVSYDDYCSSSNIVVEFTCTAPGIPEGTNHNCDSLNEYSSGYCIIDGNTSSVYRDYNDYFCSGGKCDYTSTPELVEECDYGCTDGECNPIPDSCQDTDGLNVLLLGTISGYLNEIFYSNDDYCYDSETVVEYTCNGDYSQNNQYSCGTDGYTSNYCENVTSDIYKDYNDYFCSGGKCDYTSTPELVEECDYGCTDGECNPENYCVDSDGNDIWNLGFVEGNLGGIPYENDDYCYDSDTVVEYICDGDYSQSNQHSCGTDEYSGNNYCITNSTDIGVYIDFIDYSCNLGECEFSIIPELVEECDYGCTDGECD